VNILILRFIDFDGVEVILGAILQETKPDMTQNFLKKYHKHQTRGWYLIVFKLVLPFRGRKNFVRFSITVLYLQIFNTKLYDFQNLRIEFNLKLFLKFIKFIKFIPYIKYILLKRKECNHLSTSNPIIPRHFSPSCHQGSHSTV